MPVQVDHVDETCARVETPVLLEDRGAIRREANFAQHFARILQLIGSDQQVGIAAPPQCRIGIDRIGKRSALGDQYVNSALRERIEQGDECAPMRYLPQGLQPRRIAQPITQGFWPVSNDGLVAAERQFDPVKTGALTRQGQRLFALQRIRPRQRLAPQCRQQHGIDGPGCNHRVAYLRQFVPKCQLLMALQL